MRASVVLLCWLLMTGAGVAQERPVPPVFVFGESDDDELRQCGVSHRSAISQVQATLRSNRISVSTSATSDNFQMYVNVNAGPAAQGRCAYNISLEFGSYGMTLVRSTDEAIFSRSVFCEKGSLLFWDPSTAQTQVNNNMADYVNQCLSEYQALPRN